MDKLTSYRITIRRVLSDLAEYVSRSENFGLEAQCVFDDTHNHYLLLYVGWDNRKRFHQTAAHLRIKDGRIWVEEDNTENGVSSRLIDSGVPQQDIVMAFHPPELRELTKYAVA
jgi:XisI protein